MMVFNDERRKEKGRESIKVLCLYNTAGVNTQDQNWINPEKV